MPYYFTNYTRKMTTKFPLVENVLKEQIEDLKALNTKLQIEVLMMI